MKGAKLSLILLAVALAAFGARYALNLVLARNLSPDSYGNLVFALRILGMVASLSLLGTATSSTRFLSKYLKHHTHESIEGFLRWNTHIVMWPFLASIAVGVTVCISMFCLDLIESRSIESYHLSVYMLWIAPLTASGLLFGAYLLCADRPVASALFSQLLPLGLQVVLFAGLLLALYAAPTKLLIVGVLGVSALLVATVQLTYIRVRTPIVLRHLWPFGKRQPVPEHPQWLRASLWLILGQSFTQIAGLVDVGLLEWTPGREAELGYYGAVLAIVNVLLVVPRATLTPFTAKISSFLDTPEGRRELQSELNRTLRFNTLIGLGLAGGILWFSRGLLSTFGPGYEAAQPALAVAVAAALVGNLGRAAIAMIARSDMERRLLILSGADFAVLLGVGAVLVGPWGITGVAVALLCAATIRITIAGVSVRRRYGIKSLGIV